MNNIIYLPNEDNSFYPTPKDVANLLLDDLDPFKTNCTNILEPSAGKGDLCNSILDILNNKISTYIKEYNKVNIDCIEIDPDLQHILKGNDFRVVHDDFLTYQTYKQYDLIVMNPPFDNGDKHLLKAISLLKYGGEVRCILNAQTIKNPYTRTRKHLLKILQEHNANITYHNNSFSNAERKTDVEVCIIKLTLPPVEQESFIMNDMKKAMPVRDEIVRDENGTIIKGDWREAIVDHYNYEVACGTKLIQEYQAMQSIFKASLDDKSSHQLLELKINNNSSRNNYSINNYLQSVRYKYWATLLYNKDFSQQLTSSLQSLFRDMLVELRDYDFSVYNIVTIQYELNKKLNTSVEETILKLFDTFTHKYHYSDKTNSGNIHYFNGWKTNDCFAVNKKVILPINAYSSWGEFRSYGLGEIYDFEKVFNYLYGASPDPLFSITNKIDSACKNGITSNIEGRYFNVSFYKKGTCHITFTNMDILHKFNIFAAKNKNWLPPCYGKKAYKDMDIEEQAVIDSFEGEESYNNVMSNTAYFITNNDELLKLN